MGLVALTPEEMEEDRRRMSTPVAPALEPVSPPPTGSIGIPDQRIEDAPVEGAPPMQALPEQQIQLPEEQVAEEMVAELPPPAQLPPSALDRLPPSLREKYEVTHDLNQPGYAVPKAPPPEPVPGEIGTLVPLTEFEIIKDQQPESEPTWFHNEMMVTRAFIDGQTLGWSNELGAGVAAAFVSMLDPDANYAEVWNDMHGLLQDETDAFAKQNPVTATVAGVAGGFASPATIAGARIAMARTGAWGTAGTIVGIGGIEGGIAGAGYAQPGQRTEGAGFGAGTGMLFAGGLHGAGVGLRGMFSDKGVGDLVKDGIVQPLNIAAEEGSGLSRFYKGLGSKFGGGRVADMSQRVIDPVKAKVKDTAARLKASIAASKEATKVAREVQREAKKLADDTKTAADKASKRIEEERLASNERQALEKSVEHVENVKEQFRDQATQNSMPQRMDGDIKDIILAEPNMNSRLAKLAEWWTKHGFSSLKGQRFVFDKNKLMEAMEEALQGNRVLSSTDKDRVRDLVTSHMDDISAGEHGVADVMGEALTELRMQLSRDIGRLSGENINLTVAGRDMMKKLDNVIESQLKGQKLSDWTNDKELWRNFSVFKQAVSDFSVGKKGNFDPEGWQVAAKKNNPSLHAKKQSPLFGPSERALDAVEENDQLLKDIKAAKDATARNAKRHATLKAKQEKKDALRAADDAFRGTALGEETTARLRQELADLEEDLATLERKSPTDENVVQSVISSLWMSAVPGIASGSFIVAALGPTIAYILANPRMQKLVAGQGVLQRHIDDIIQYFNPVQGQAALAGGVANVERESRPDE